jgi:hypothetical protein
MLCQRASAAGRSELSVLFCGPCQGEIIRYRVTESGQTTSQGAMWGYNSTWDSKIAGQMTCLAVIMSSIGPALAICSTWTCYRLVDYETRNCHPGVAFPIFCACTH